MDADTGPGGNGSAMGLGVKVKNTVELMIPLQQEYLKSLPAKIMNLERLLHGLSAEDGRMEALELITQAVHQLHGSAGTYGLHQTSRRAAEWEEALVNLQKLPRLPDQEDVGRMVAFLENIKESILLSDPSGEARSVPSASTQEGGALPPVVPGSPDPCVLLVEDDGDLTALIKNALAGQNIGCLEAGTVGAGLQAFGRRPIDLVITDYRLPDGRGRELAHWIRERDVDVPILLVSGTMDKAELGEMFREAVDEFIEKPFAVGALVTVAKRLMALGEERRKTKTRGEVLLDISSNAILGMTTEDLLPMLLKAVPQITPLRSATLYLLSPDRQTLRKRIALCPGADPRRETIPLSIVERLHAQGYKLDIAAFVPCEGEDQEASAGDRRFLQVEARRHAWRAGDAVWVEIRTAERLWGFLFAEDPADGTRPTNDAMRMLSLLANNIANVLANQDMYRVQQRLNYQLQTVGEIIKTALAVPNLDLIKTMVAEAAVHRFKNDFACFVEKNGETGEYVINHAAARRAEEIPAGKVLGSKKIVELLRRIELSKMPYHLRASEGGTGLAGRGKACTSYAIPIYTGNTLRHIFLVEDDHLTEFDETQVLVYKTLTDQIGLIWSKWLYQKYLEDTASELKESHRRLQSSHEMNLRLQNIIKRYVPQSTWQSALGASETEEVKSIEDVSDIPVMFVDLAGFTRLTESAKPHQVVELLNVYFTSTSSIIVQCEGEIIKYIGDGVMAYFKSREQAVRAADDILKSQAKLNLALSQVFLEDVQLRIGIAYGPVILCHVGPFYHKDRTLLGDTVNTASRLEQRAVSGTALLDSHLLPDQARPEDLGLVRIPRISVKGKDKPVEVLTFARDRHLYVAP